MEFVALDGSEMRFRAFMFPGMMRIEMLEISKNHFVWSLALPLINVKNEKSDHPEFEILRIPMYDFNVADTKGWLSCQYWNELRMTAKSWHKFVLFCVFLFFLLHIFVLCF